MYGTAQGDTVDDRWMTARASFDGPAITLQSPLGERESADDPAVTHRHPSDVPAVTGQCTFGRHNRNSRRWPTGRHAVIGRRPAGDLPTSEFS